jgi:hypothetical protein
MEVPSRSSITTLQEIILLDEDASHSNSRVLG